MESGRTSKRRAEIFRAIKFYPGKTRGELAEITGLRLSTICGRVNELMKAGAVIEDPARKCSTSGRSAHPLRAVEVPVQLDFAV